MKRLSKRSIEGNFGKLTKPPENALRQTNNEAKLELALNQASIELQESMAHIRAMDTKLYGLVIFSSALLALLVTVKPWSFKGIVGTSFFVLAFAAYLVIIGLGMKEYFPVELETSNARAILEDTKQPYDKLVKWTVEDLLDCAEKNYSIAYGKTRTLRVMLIVFLVAAVCLSFGTLLY
jgi:hypothetical protein